MSSLIEMQLEPIEKGIYHIDSTTDFPMIGFKYAHLNGEQYDIAPSDLYPAGTKIFTSSGIWKAPFTGEIEVFMVNGGNGGWTGSGSRYAYAYGGTGGEGGYTLTKTLNVVAGTSYSIVVGAGGVSCGLGGTSSFDSNSPTAQAIRKGGSGGGKGGYSSPSESISSQPGASDGANGSAGTGSTGQGTTTREFAQSGATLYSGGGGGGGSEIFTSSYSMYPTVGSNGGAGGGGKGGYATSSGVVIVASSGTPNSGGGGGGGGLAQATDAGVELASVVGEGGTGGSGIVIIRWKDQKK